MRNWTLVEFRSCYCYAEEGRLGGALSKQVVVDLTTPWFAPKIPHYVRNDKPRIGVMPRNEASVNCTIMKQAIIDVVHSPLSV